MEYKFFERKQFKDEEDIKSERFDIFISAYTLEERVLKVFDSVNSQIKIWLIFPEYDYENVDVNGFRYPNKNDENGYFDKFFEENPNLLMLEEWCIDATGFVTPYLIYLMKYLQVKGKKLVKIIYSEPDTYVNGEETSFSKGDICDVRGIKGFQGSSIEDPSQEILIINIGFDKNMISHILNKKEKTNKKYLIYGYPSVMPEMYQQSILGTNSVLEHESEKLIRTEFASAINPYGYADKLSQIYKREKKNYPFFSFCPLGNKIQSIGLVIFFLYEMLPLSGMILYPFSNKYDPKSSTGLRRIWMFCIVFPELFPYES